MLKKFLLVLLCLALLPVCAPAADIASLDEAGLKSLLEQNRGKVVMLNFFATWCPPCKAEIPELVKLRKEWPEDKLAVVGLSVDENRSALPPFIQKSGVNYPVFMADRSITDAYNVTSVPHNAFIAPDGRLIISEPGMADASVLKQVVTDLLR